MEKDTIMAARNIASILAKLTPEEVAEILTQSADKATAKAKSDAHKAQYGKALVDFVTQVIEHEGYEAPEGKDWAGYKGNLYGIPVVVEGHTFTVTVTVTDLEAKQARENVRKVAEARALLGLDESSEEGDSEEGDSEE